MATPEHNQSGSPGSFDGVAASLAPEILSQFRSAIELGRWADGRTLSPQQKALVLEAVLRAEIAQGVPEAERTGYIDRSNLRSRRADASAPDNLIHREE